MSSRDASYPMVPPGALPCVWMRAGVLRFKLCSRRLACDGCPLYLALREESSPISAPGEVSFPPDRRYLPGHLWMLRLPTGGRLGVDGFAAAQLGPVQRVACPGPGTALPAGAPLAHLTLRSGELTIRAPCRATVCGSNRALATQPDLVRSSPYDAGWLAELELGAPLSPKAGMSNRQAKRLADADGHALRDAVVGLTSGTTSRTTMTDGGRLHPDAAMAGGERYLALLAAMIG